MKEKVGSKALWVRPMSPDEIEARLRLESAPFITVRASAEWAQRTGMTQGLKSREARAPPRERKRLKDLRKCVNLKRWV